MQVDAPDPPSPAASASSAQRPSSSNEIDSEVATVETHEDEEAAIQGILDATLDDLESSSPDEEEYENGTPRRTYLHQYVGHVSSMTIKGSVRAARKTSSPTDLATRRCNFFGRRSEWVISGSDDARVYFWNKRSGALVNVLSGHDDVVNCTVASPTYPMLATSGIDNNVKLWEPLGRLSEKDAARREKLIADLAEAHREPYDAEDRSDIGSMCAQQ